jgi:hypothetical protein
VLRANGGLRFLKVAYGGDPSECAPNTLGLLAQDPRQRGALHC